MKKLAFILSFVLTFVALPGLASAAEVIRDFSVTVKPDGGRRLVFEESIEYDFGEASRHGIFRYIPETYDRNGGTYNYHLEVIGVWRDGQAEPYAVSRSGGNVDIKIGDADRTITGAHVYVIRYATDRAINFFDTHSELYWNVTGNGWQVPIEKVSIDFGYLDAIQPENVRTDCFTGVYGSTQKDCDVADGPNGAGFTSRRVLQPSEGLTVVWGFEGGQNFPAPTFWEKAKMLLADNFVLFLPFIVFAFMFWRWWTKGKDAKLNTVIPEYEAPRKFTPAMVGAAMTSATVPDRTVTATIIDLARRGYLKIKFGEKKGLFGTSQTFTFVKQVGDEAALRDYEKTVLIGLFKSGDEQSVDGLKDGKFYTTVSSFRNQVTKHINALKLFDKNPTLVRTGYIVAAAAVVFVGFAMSGNALGSFSAVVSGIIVAVFGWVMPRRTSEGTQVLTDIEGFKWFLSVTEKDRMDFHNAPERTPEQFQALLPYAIVFGVENKWAAQFASMHLPPPDWATGNVSSMNTVLLASSLSSLHSAASSAAFSPPSSAGSGGSGFSGGGSGGGGGGGGGGSW